MAKIKFYKTEDFPASGPDGLYFLRDGDEFSLFVRSGGELYIMHEDDPTVPEHVKEITSTDISNWDTAFGMRHAHGNKTILDGITGISVSAWDEAYALRHSHTNKSTLDAIEEAFTTALKNKLDGIETGANNYTHPDSGVAAGTYNNVTVDEEGHVTNGTNVGYITNAALAGYATESWVESQEYITEADLPTDYVDTHSWQWNIEGNKGWKDAHYFLHQSTYMGYGTGADTNVTMGEARTANGYAFLDFKTDTSNAVCFRIQRGPGINGGAFIADYGTGGLSFYNDKAASMVFYINAAVNNVFHANGISTFGSGAISGAYKVQIDSGSDTGDGLRVRGKIYATDNIQAFSDRRGKEDIRPIEDPIEKVLQLNGVDYFRTGDREQRRGGHISQDVQKVLPYAVSDIGGTLALDNSPILALHTEAIKAMVQKEKDLEGRIALLEEKIKMLEAKFG